LLKCGLKKKLPNSICGLLKLDFRNSPPVLLESETFAGENPEPDPKVTSDPDPELQI
jgi:hypothetical protein